MATIAQTLATYVSALRFEDLSASVVQKAKMAVLDTLGVALAGSQTAESQAMAAAVARFDDGSRATVWGRGAKASLPAAALLNGTAAHARELDDWGAGLHSGAVVIPTILALSESTPLSGRALLVAVVAGYEVMIRAARAAGGDAQYRHGWHPTGTCGTFGAAVAAGKALDLDAQQLVWALGLAGSYTGGTMAFNVDGAMSKRYHPGKAAESGLVAAFMAKEGFTGPAHIFEAEQGGFLTSYGDGLSHAGKLTEGLGQEFAIMRTGLKPYASCRDVHAAIDAILAIEQAHPIQPQEVYSVLVESTEEAELLCAKNVASTVLDAQMSIPYGVAIALLTGEAGLAQYAPEYLADPNVAGLMARVSVVRSCKFAGMEHCAEVTVRTKGGQLFSERVDVSRGDPKNPLTPPEVRRKYSSLASLALSDKDVQCLADVVEGLEDVRDAGHLCALLQGQRVL